MGIEWDVVLGAMEGFEGHLVGRAFGVQRPTGRDGFDETPGREAPEARPELA